jgi:hypothetical protein
MELIIKELKYDYPLAKIPTSQFAANEAYFHLLLFAYNLMNWFKRLCLPAAHQSMTLATLRRELLMLPGELVRTKNIPTLRLPPSEAEPTLIQHALDRIGKLKI